MFHTKLICIKRGDTPQGKSCVFKDGYHVDFRLSGDTVVAELFAPQSSVPIAARTKNSFDGKWGPFAVKSTHQDYYVKISKEH